VRDVPVNIREAVRASATPKKLYDDAIADGSLADMERRKIFAALQKHGANRTQAALELGISRRTLHRKLREYKELGLLGE
jgi:transcriptional regulator of acetoin/glycerol metabolism